MDTLKKIWLAVKTAFLKVGGFFDAVAGSIGRVYRVIMRFRKIFITISYKYIYSHLFNNTLTSSLFNNIPYTSK